MMLKKTLESHLDCKEMQPVHPKGDQSWMFFGRNDLRLKLQYFGPIMQRVESLEKTLMLGGIGGRRRRGRQRMRWLDGITDSMDVSLSDCYASPRIPHKFVGSLLQKDNLLENFLRKSHALNYP